MQTRPAFRIHPCSFLFIYRTKHRRSRSSRENDTCASLNLPHPRMRPARRSARSPVSFRNKVRRTRRDTRERFQDSRFSCRFADTTPLFQRGPRLKNGRKRAVRFRFTHQPTYELKLTTAGLFIADAAVFIQGIPAGGSSASFSPSSCRAVLSRLRRERLTRSSSCPSGALLH